MPRATSNVNSGMFSNTFKGSTNKRGEFIHDTDESGSWIKTNNLKMVGPEKYVMPKQLDSDYVASLLDAYPDLSVQPNSDYILISTNSLEANEELDLDACSIGFYKPKRASVALPPSGK